MPITLVSSCVTLLIGCAMWLVEACLIKHCALFTHSLQNLSGSGCFDHFSF